MSWKCASVARAAVKFRTTQQFRAYRPVRTPIDEKYEVVEPEEVSRLQERTAGHAERLKRYNRDIDRRRESFRSRSHKYMRPFSVDVFLSAKYIHCTIMHRAQHRVVATVSTNAKDMRALLPSRVDLSACRIVGETLAERAKEADCYAVLYNPRKEERLEGKLATVLQALANSGISIYHDEKGLLLTKD